MAATAAERPLTVSFERHHAGHIRHCDPCRGARTSGLCHPPRSRLAVRVDATRRRSLIGAGVAWEISRTLSQPNAACARQSTLRARLDDVSVSCIAFALYGLAYMCIFAA